ncbi:S8 family peptidase [Candidatus Uabimicrobium amorphum]|uniref:Subtilisin E n=1 Tax=Uabimicrobium amorphum TaxID=2596890 RepID=A0A5S9ISY7_UABAM|nr:S8/S53 family peptidase [Candidatus Uabimicrobium amorphum]BBM86570.1 subtilisin E [Candidatus Uabimicrobium amorphum]
MSQKHKLQEISNKDKLSNHQIFMLLSGSFLITVAVILIIGYIFIHRVPKKNFIILSSDTKFELINFEKLPQLIVNVKARNNKLNEYIFKHLSYKTKRLVNNEEVINKLILFANFDQNKKKKILLDLNSNKKETPEFLDKQVKNLLLRFIDDLNSIITRKDVYKKERFSRIPEEILEQRQNAKNRSDIIWFNKAIIEKEFDETSKQQLLVVGDKILKLKWGNSLNLKFTRLKSLSKTDIENIDKETKGRSQQILKSYQNKLLIVNPIETENESLVLASETILGTDYTEELPYSEINEKDHLYFSGRFIVQANDKTTKQQIIDAIAKYNFQIAEDEVYQYPLFQQKKVYCIQHKSTNVEEAFSNYPELKESLKPLTLPPHCEPESSLITFAEEAGVNVFNNSVTMPESKIDEKLKVSDSYSSLQWYLGEDLFGLDKLMQKTQSFFPKILFSIPESFEVKYLLSQSYQNTNERGERTYLIEPRLLEIINKALKEKFPNRPSLSVTTTVGQEFDTRWCINDDKNHEYYNIIIKDKLLQFYEPLRIAIIDKAIDWDHFDLKKCRPKVAYRYNFFSNEPENDRQCYPAPNEIHGTQVAGIICADRSRFGIYGLTDYVKIFSLKCQSKSETKGKRSEVQDPRGLIRCFQKAIDKRVKIINMSFSIPSLTASEETIIKEALDEGIIVVGAAGNRTEKAPNRTNDIQKLAEKCPIIIVGATDVNKQIIRRDSTIVPNVGEKYWWENIEHAITIRAPGTFIITTDPQTNVGSAPPEVAVKDQNFFSYMSQSSSATPIITAVVSWLLRKKSDMTPAQVKNILTLGGTTAFLQAEKSYDNIEMYLK